MTLFTKSDNESAPMKGEELDLVAHCNKVQNLKFNEKIILFGTDDNFKSDSVLDFIILYAKYFIYSCRYEKIKPQLCAFRKELKKR